LETERIKDRSGLKLLMVIGTAWLFDAADVALLSFIMPLLKKEMTLTDGQIGLVSSITTVGMMIGAVLFGYLADKFGKKISSSLPCCSSQSVIYS
jgi:Nitrate/nitrite transporter